MRAIVTFFVILLNFILQSTLFEHIEIIGIKPNTAIIIVVSYAMLRGDLEGAIIGFFSGLLQDIFFGRFIGLYSLLGMLTGYFCGKPFKNFYSENFILPLFLVAVSIIGYEFAFYFSSFLFRGKVDFFYYFGTIILPEAAYNTILSIPIYRLVYAINDKICEFERKNRKLF